MFKESLEWAVGQINKCFNLSSEVDSYMIGLGGPALKFAESVWDVAMILASVVFAIVACYELYAVAVRTEARGGPMGSAEVAFKVMFKVAVCFLLIQVSFDVLVNLYKTSNSFTEAIGGIKYGTAMSKDVIDWDKVSGDVPGGLKGIGPLFMAMLVLIFCWAARIAAIVMILMRLLQVYIYIAVAPVPLATLPSQEYSQVAKSFIKSFVAVCLQGTMIYLVVRFLPAMLDTALTTDLFTPGKETSLTGRLLVAWLYSVAILITLVGSQQLSRRICGAM